VIYGQNIPKKKSENVISSNPCLSDVLLKKIQNGGSLERRQMLAIISIL
jgi:hypothetical protein